MPLEHCDCDAPSAAPNVAPCLPVRAGLQGRPAGCRKTGRRQPCAAAQDLQRAFPQQPPDLVERAG
eukprot:1986956-Lingulodinium_polyedra.AAC.1